MILDNTKEDGEAKSCSLIFGCKERLKDSCLCLLIHSDPGVSNGEQHFIAALRRSHALGPVAGVGTLVLGAAC